MVFLKFSLVYTLMGKIDRDEVDDIGKKEQNCKNNILEQEMGMDAQVGQLTLATNRGRSSIVAMKRLHTHTHTHTHIYLERERGRYAIL